jgi:hypothetical protein
MSLTKLSLVVKNLQCVHLRIVYQLNSAAFYYTVVPFIQGLEHTSLQFISNGFLGGFVCNVEPSMEPTQVPTCPGKRPM